MPPRPHSSRHADTAPSSTGGERRVPRAGTEHLGACAEEHDLRVRESVLTRGMRVLEAFADTHSPLTLSEIKERSDLPLTTTHRLVGALVAVGALDQVRPRRYQVGSRLIAIVSGASSSARDLTS